MTIFIDKNVYCPMHEKASIITTSVNTGISLPNSTPIFSTIQTRATTYINSYSRRIYGDDGIERWSEMCPQELGT
jgi:hypothetical protein